MAPNQLIRSVTDQTDHRQSHAPRVAPSMVSSFETPIGARRSTNLLDLGSHARLELEHEGVFVLLDGHCVSEGVIYEGDVQGLSDEDGNARERGNRETRVIVDNPSEVGTFNGPAGD